MFGGEKCNETIDLEDYIRMKNQSEKQNIRIIATYKSGREETYTHKLNKGGSVKKDTNELISALRSFPTVDSVKTILI